MGGIIIVILTMASVIRYQNGKLEKAHEREIFSIQTAHEREVQSIKDGCAATLQATQADKDRGWAQSGVWQQQAERLAERYTEATQLAADMSDEVLQRRRRPSK